MFNIEKRSTILALSYALVWQLVLIQGGTWEIDLEKQTKFPVPLPLL